MTSPWVSSTAPASALAVIKAADDLQAKIPGSLFYAYHSVGFCFLVSDPSALTFSHGYGTLEQAIGNSNDAGGPSAGGLGTGGGADLANLETASGASGSGAGGGTGANSYVAAWFNVTTINDAQSQGQSPTGPHRRQITGIVVGNVLTGTGLVGSATKTVGDVVKTLSKADQAALASGLNSGKAANPGAVPAASGSSSAGSALGSFFDWSGWLSGFTSSNLWVRVAKVAVGGVLLIVGAAKLTGADKSVAVLGKAVAKAPLL